MHMVTTGSLGMRTPTTTMEAAIRRERTCSSTSRRCTFMSTLKVTNLLNPYSAFLITFGTELYVYWLDRHWFRQSKGPVCLKKW